MTTDTVRVWDPLLRICPWRPVRASLRHHENLAHAMVTSKKRGPVRNEIALTIPPRVQA